jgi:hypothetical protein
MPGSEENFAALLKDLNEEVSYLIACTPKGISINPVLLNI